MKRTLESGPLHQRPGYVAASGRVDRGVFRWSPKLRSQNPAAKAHGRSHFHAESARHLLNAHQLVQQRLIEMIHEKCNPPYLGLSTLGPAIKLL